MFVPEEMKLNKFKPLALPSARDYLKQNPDGKNPGDSDYSGDNVESSSDGSKVGAIEAFRKSCRKLAEAKKIVKQDNDEQ